MDNSNPNNETSISQELQEKIDTLNTWVNESKSTVFFGGAGVSTESGIPDFRSVDGLYNQKYDYPPETMISHTFFVKHPDEFYRFYKDKLIIHGVKPNITHNKLAELENAGKLDAVVTQNIDGLHQMAGSKKVYELHGTVLRNYCTQCGKRYEGTDVIENAPGVPKCTCGGTIKPDVVLYEEGLDQDILEGAVNAIANADLLIVGGTSLVVYPAAGLLTYFRGSHLVLVNKSSTPMDHRADLVINCGLGEVFKRIQVG
ncbi:MAG: NAD-dependent protein deacylase [Lachnospiraceae bacterium]|nr:NAD-dependent protein deacylase [Lachnospiraceae bacterium]